MAQFVITKSHRETVKYLVDAETETEARQLSDYEAIELVRQEENQTKVEPFSQLVQAKGLVDKDGNKIA